MNTKAPAPLVIKYLLAAAILLSTQTSCTWSIRNQKLDKPPKGFVPDAETAKHIAEAVWIPIFGAEEVANQMPLRAQLKGKIWIIEGTLNGGGRADSGFIVGGVAVAEIAKDDGRIIRVYHGE